MSCAAITTRPSPTPATAEHPHPSRPAVSRRVGHVLACGVAAGAPCAPRWCVAGGLHLLAEFGALQSLRSTPSPRRSTTSSSRPSTEPGRRCSPVFSSSCASRYSESEVWAAGHARVSYVGSGAARRGRSAPARCRHPSRGGGTTPTTPTSSRSTSLVAPQAGRPETRTSTTPGVLSPSATPAASRRPQRRLDQTGSLL